MRSWTYVCNCGLTLKKFEHVDNDFHFTCQGIRFLEENVHHFILLYAKGYQMTSLAAGI